MAPEQLKELGLEILALVMLLLMCDIGFDLRHGGFADREPAIALLP
jgi:hypothetical protein